ncbi:MAG: nicotinamide mononucleotide transporter, partial [Proteiniphilum sp.]|nr:nicotinamide mononucleotide transporter [Proteiniphilum sp.]
MTFDWNWWLELFAATLGVRSVWYARKENILVFPFGIVNVLIYIYICFAARLYANAGINMVYFISNAFGWYMWGKNDDGESRVEIAHN